MTLREVCKREVLRLSGLPFFPAEPLAVKELVDALAEIASDASHARRTIDELVIGDRCPMPLDIRRVGHSLRPPAPNPHAGCRDCGGTGWVHVVVRGYSAVRECQREA